MLLAYVDESYTKERYYMAALLVPGDAAVSLTRALDEVVRKATIDHGGIHPQAELHGYDLVAGKGDWIELAPKIRARISVYNKALQAIADHEVAVILRGVHVTRLHQRYPKPDHPHSIVLTHLIERVDEYAESMDELALMIADEVSGQDDYRRDLWEYQRVATRGYRARQITRVVDTIHSRHRRPAGWCKLPISSPTCTGAARPTSRRMSARREPTARCGRASCPRSTMRIAGSPDAQRPRTWRGLRLTGAH